jgi:regulatory protein
MVITAMIPHPRRKSRITVYLDGIVAGELTRASIKKHTLRPGLELTAEQFEAVVAEEQRRQALDAAVGMLARRPHSEREVRQRLRRRKLDAAVIDQTLERLKEALLIDDAEFARSYADLRLRASPRSRRLVQQELRAAGVEAAVASDAVEELSDDEAAYRLACGRMRSLSRLDADAFAARLAGLLRRRGFGWDVTRRTLERCRAEVYASGQ